MSKFVKSWRARAGALVFCGSAALFGAGAEAAVPGITGTSFSIDASEAYTSHPDGTMLYSWGYGCAAGSTPSFLPTNWTSPGGSGAAQSATNAAAPPVCPLMQVPGPTLIVTEGTAVTVTLTNNLPVAAGNTSIIFTGFPVSATGGVPGTAVQEAVHGGTVTYTFTASKPGTYAYYSGTQADVQIDMGLYGALIVLPNPASATAAVAAGMPCTQGPYSLAATAYDNIYTCYDREYLFQLSEASLAVHQGAYDQVQACNSTLAASPTATCAPISVPTEPYRPDFFMINGRSMPDDFDPHYVQSVAHQPYNGNPHMHPGENMLVRIIGQGRIQHPFHIHGNHERAIARDGNLIVAQADVAAGVPVLNQRLGGPVLFTISSVSGQTIDGIFNWTGKGLNWDVYGHVAGDGSTCTPDVNGFDKTTKEWCADHLKPIPVTPPDPIVVANGQWYGGTPYLGLQSASPNPLPPTGSRLNGGAGYAYMWHSHDEREITTRNVFPGGLMTMLIIDPPSSPIDETQ
jgi:hypothetical protein